MTLTRRLFLGWLIGLAFLVPATAFAEVPATSQPAVRVLFIGNSYTAFNGGLPKILKQMADDVGRKFEADASLAGGKSLEFHWNETKAREKIAQGHYDSVVLQDYSTQALGKRDLMFAYARKFDAEIEKSGAKTVFYMTWARQNAPEKQEIITDAYQTIAEELGAKVAPVGRAWKRVLTERPELILHFDDKSHPNPLGTYLTACVFYQTLLGSPPPAKAPAVFNQRTSKMDEIPPETAAYLRRVAIETASAATTRQAVEPASR